MKKIFTIILLFIGILSVNVNALENSYFKIGKFNNMILLNNDNMITIPVVKDG